ncbi:hypothetical protein EW145_g820 [Phellinidium pouzarii]|uniref:Carbohydrate kinase PfkB domain-containing protein n=1 Tax=Phellinidium pouzarii TaxID=167371 RepID=A0A4S4LGX5_9AGAM|nr:hypothetical protein EW145_g820 [Phellinidium pouzarii]
MIRIASFTVLAAFLFAQALAVPVSEPLPSVLEARSPAPFEPIVAYARRATTNTIPAEVATKAPNGVIELYGNDKREEKRATTNTIPAEVATKAPNGVIELYGNGKREEKRASTNTIPAEVATKAPNGVIELYGNGKREEKRAINARTHMAFSRVFNSFVAASRARSYATHSSALPRSLVQVLKRGAAIDVHPEVQDALAARRPVVALETALVTNGVAPPTNLEVARKLESIVRAQGAVPATIGIIDGRIKIGLQNIELERLADTERNKRIVSRRDIGPALALRMDGGTTICSTLIFAHLSGIKVIATGGLGGVHRDGENTMDVSADLHELTRCPVGLVSCGVKSILDIGRTLEYLETLGVPVVTYGETNNFPAFFCGQSDFKTNWKVNDPRTAADILNAQWLMGMQNGTLFAAPIPEEYAMQGEEIKAAVDQAVRESEENGISKNGKEVTPWLLARVVELTGGKSLQSNLALLENTAVIGGQIAVEYAKLQDQLRENSSEPLGLSRSTTNHLSSSEIPSRSHVNHLLQSTNQDPKAPERKTPSKLIVIGASAIDITGRVVSKPNEFTQVAQSTAPGTVSLTVGGVARNIAEAAHRILSSGRDGDPYATLLVSPVGHDEFARFLVDEYARLGMRNNGLLRVEDCRTAVCDMVLDTSGALVGGVADMDIIRNVSENAVINCLKDEDPYLVAMDGNLSPSTLSAILAECCNRQKPIASFFEPTSISKASSILPAIMNQLMTNKTGTTRSPVTYTSPNLIELSHMYHEANSETFGLINHRLWWDVINSFSLGSTWRMDLDQLARQPACPIKDKGDLSFLVKDGVGQMAINLLPFFQNIIIKCGERGVIVVMRFSGEDAMNTSWADERSNPFGRYIIAKSHNSKELVVLRHFPAIPVNKDEIVSVTGAGDSMVGALCASIVNDPSTFHHTKRLDAAIQLSQEAAVLSLHSVRAISPLLGKGSG